jgi:hypothetical protein
MNNIIHTSKHSVDLSDITTSNDVIASSVPKMKAFNSLLRAPKMRPLELTTPIPALALPTSAIDAFSQSDLQKTHK